MRNATVGQLKKLLQDVPDDTLVVVPASDHSYREVSASVTTAILDARYDHLSEDFGGGYEPEHDDWKRINVVLVGG